MTVTGGVPVMGMSAGGCGGAAADSGDGSAAAGGTCGSHPSSGAIGAPAYMAPEQVLENR
ncbi:hypothetical protein I6A60_36565 [Frankia sp. AgB1.9]|uniref:hypothetical protein n=1 Tax=unclassified Frankia TaxID=2632575 RepID=UPI001931DD8E|nr:MULTISPECIES: hypothetical protein [unclassified Frankia]MBL7488152.1 hypothetical protein [Frankia sp. AgW1.1]MBL7553326.1 hypothetical protein [Frankia sp. AgB1.9]MBL7620155.1 hypothetical protein [Frankia sp. AgB1.8]